MRRCGVNLFVGTAFNPLVIAEFDETLLALKKSTVSVIADLAAGESDIQFSNFSLLENRETHQIELFLTNYGVDGTSLGGDSLKYTLTFKKPGDYNADGKVDVPTKLYGVRS